jgi:DNA repair photolyase
LRPLLGEEASSLPELALRFVLSRPEVSTVIPGMRRPEHASANASVSDGRTLSTALLERLAGHAWDKNWYGPADAALRALKNPLCALAGWGVDWSGENKTNIMDDPDRQPDEGRERPRPVRGRGAVSSPAARFEPRHVVLDDGWEDDPDFAPPTRVPTTVTPEATRSIFAKNDSPDGPLRPVDQSLQGVRARMRVLLREADALVPGTLPRARLRDEDRLQARCRRTPRRGAAQAVLPLRRRRARREHGPYQPVERELGITRSLLEVLDAFRHPVCIVTKSNLVLRDLDILQRLASRRQASVLLSITTLDRELARRMEPRAPTPQRRLEAVAALHSAGVPVGVLTAPIIPGLNDAELERLLEAAAAAGAQGTDYVLLRLPFEVKEILSAWLEEHYPLRAQHVLSLVRQTHEGKLYDSTYGTRMRGTGAYADQIAQRFEKACARLGLNRRLPPLDTGSFRPPPRPTILRASSSTDFRSRAGRRRSMTPRALAPD